MPVDHREKAFESAIEDSLLTAGGYIKVAHIGRIPNSCLKEKSLSHLCSSYL